MYSVCVSKRHIERRIRIRGEILRHHLSAQFPSTNGEQKMAKKIPTKMQKITPNQLNVSQPIAGKRYLAGGKARRLASQ